MSTEEKPPRKIGRPSKDSLVNGMPPIMDRFAQEYALEPNGTQAAIKAGYSKVVAMAKASTLLKDERVKNAIDMYRREAVRRFRLKAEDVLEELAKVAMEPDITPHKMKALELLGKHFQLFVERVEVSVDTLPAEERAARAAALISLARARLGEAQETEISVEPLKEDE